MAYERSNTVSSTQAADVYADIAAKLTEEGWIKQGTTLVDVTFTWRVWQAPQANTLLPYSFHIAIGHANTGTGSLLFRVFRDWVSGSRIRRPIPNYNFTPGNVADAYGDKHHDTASALYPVPWSAGEGPWAIAPGNNPDFSVAMWHLAADVGALTTFEQNALAAAPPQMDYRSFYVREMTLSCDDSTAVEYIIHVTPKRLVIGTKLIFNNTQHRMYVGAYEPLSLYDAMPIAMGDPIGNATGYMYDWRYVDLPATIPTSSRYVGSTNNSAFYGGTTAEFGRIYGQILQDQSETFNLTDLNWRGPLGARRAFMDTLNAPRGLMLDMPCMPEVTTGGTPKIDFGDEVLINGQPHTLLWPGTSTNSLWVPQS